jgi:hypothetical protein
MRSYYLNEKSGSFPGATCRGGVHSINPDSGNIFDLEIGQSCYVSSEMMSFCIHIDAILEYLKIKQDCPIAKMILDSYEKTKLNIKDKPFIA